MRLAVFDCDGTLVDSQANIIAAMRTTFAQAGLPPPADPAIRRIVGLSVPQAVQQLAPGHSAETLGNLASGYRQAFAGLRRQSLMAPEPLFAGIDALLAELADEGWLLAVATGKSDRGLRHCLEHHRIIHHFISLQTADHHPSKPDPAMLLACLADAGVNNHEATIIGDTSFDMAMGQAIGVRALGVAWGYHPPAELLAAGAEAVADNSTHLHELLNG